LFQVFFNNLLEDPMAVRQPIRTLRDDILHDAYIRGIIPYIALRGQGRNYWNDDPEVRSRVIDQLSRLLFEAYACFAKRSFFGSLDEHGVRAMLLGRLFYERLRAYRNREILIRNREILINVSTDGETSIEDMGAVIQISLRDILDREGLSFKRLPVLVRADSEDGCIAAGNYVSAITRAKLDTPDSPEARAFEKIRSKMRLVHDLATDEFYSRDRQLP
jgi:hypothetical protein